jgi:hypothetical protein
MIKQNFTAMLVSYRGGALSRKTISEAISLFVYKFPLRMYKWKEDDCSDFFSYFYPKIHKMIDSFEIREIPFEVYLIKTLKLQIKTFAARKAAEANSIKILQNREFWTYEFLNNSSFCFENDAGYSKSDSGIMVEFLNQNLNCRLCGISRDSTLKKRMLMLALKIMRNVAENDIRIISSMLDCDCIWLLGAVEILKLKREQKTARKQFLEERRNRHFCRLCLLHESFYSSGVLEERAKLASEISRVKISIDKLAKKIDMIVIEPTHQDIAEVMKVPKGSVDSGLFYLKLYLENN